MNKKRLAILLLLLNLLLLASACAPEGPLSVTDLPLPTPTRQPTERPLPTATVKPSPTLRPSPVPTNTLQPTPTPTPLPDPAALLDEAWAEMDRLGTFRAEGDVTMNLRMSGLSMEIETSLDAAYHVPDRASGTMTMAMFGEESESSYIVIGDEVYLRDQPGSDWYVGDPISLDYPGLNGANAFAPRDSESLQDLRVIGEETLHGQPVIHVRGALAPGVYSDMAVTEPAQVDIWIGRDDACVYRTVVETDGTMIDEALLPEEAAVHMLIEMNYKDFGEPVLIAAPRIPQRYAPAASLLLGYFYELPHGWDVEEWGEADCQEATCRGIRLTKSGIEGDSIVTIANSDADTAAAARNGPGRFVYSDSSLGDMAAWWCEAKGEAGGFLTAADGTILEVRGQWPANSEDGAVIQATAASLKPLAPVAQSFRRYDLQNWIAIDMPEEWFIVRGQYPGELALSTRNAPVHSYDLTEQDALVLISAFGEGWEPAMALLEGTYLEGILYEYTITIPPTPTTINGYPAAKASYSSASQSGGSILEQVTIVEGPSRNILIVTVTKDGALAEHAHTFAAMLDSLEIRQPLAAPQPVYSGAVPPDYTSYDDTELDLTLSYPPGWEVSNNDEGALILAPPSTLAATAILISDASELVFVDEWSTGELLWEAVYAVWSVLPPDMQTLGEPLFSAVVTQEIGIVRIAMTQEGIPISGFLAVLRRGDHVVTIVALSDNLPVYEEELIRILSSIKLDSLMRTAG